ncbi:MAG: ribonuclease P protein component [Candidatus Riflebacteria bacterium]|nr:ribonuclease P protein component [Candidatus Riflebacteria bacterium]
MSVSRSTLRAHSEFKRVYSAKTRLFRNGLVFYYRKADGVVFRFAVSVPKRYGKAVERNKVRRRLKEIIRTAETLPEMTEVVFGVNSKCSELSYMKLKLACDWAFEKMSRDKRR